jgi:hypothetical protein
MGKGGMGNGKWSRDRGVVVIFNFLFIIINAAGGEWRRSDARIRTKELN